MISYKRKKKKGKKKERKRNKKGSKQTNKQKERGHFNFMWIGPIPFFVLQETFSANLVHDTIFLMGVGRAPSFCIPFLSDTDVLTAQNDISTAVVSSETHKY